MPSQKVLDIYPQPSTHRKSPSSDDNKKSVLLWNCWQQQNLLRKDSENPKDKIITANGFLLYFRGFSLNTKGNILMDDSERTVHLLFSVAIFFFHSIPIHCNHYPLSFPTKDIHYTQHYRNRTDSRPIQPHYMVIVVILNYYCTLFHRFHNGWPVWYALMVIS